tara:strand:+ start:589 stop:1521 length:933 start_codon:yes stop_codon:yes gene_type:complete
MYKRLSLKNIIYETSSINFIVFWTFFISFQNSWSQTNVINNHSNDTIVVLITNENKEIRGLLISEDYNSLIIEIANENMKFNKNEIKSYRYITRNQIKSIKEFKNPNPIYTKYCYFPSAYITEKGNVNTNTHYFITSNSKIGVHENFEISVGNIFIYNVFSLLTYSKKINNSFTSGISLIGSVNLLTNLNGINEFNSWGFLPRITYGNVFQNTTIGMIGYHLPVLEEFYYGGYLASQKKISERFTLAGEIIGITVDGLQLGLINNIIINFARNFRENWSIGITLVNVQTINNALGIEAIAIPYLGLQKKF